MNFKKMTEATKWLNEITGQTIEGLSQRDLALLRKYTKQVESMAKAVAELAKAEYVGRYGYGKHTIDSGKDLLIVDVKIITSKQLNRSRLKAEKPDIYAEFTDETMSDRMTVK